MSSRTDFLQDDQPTLAADSMGFPIRKDPPMNRNDGENRNIFPNQTAQQIQNKALDDAEIAIRRRNYDSFGTMLFDDSDTNHFSRRKGNRSPTDAAAAASSPPGDRPITPDLDREFQDILPVHYAPVSQAATTETPEKVPEKTVTYQMLGRKASGSRSNRGLETTPSGVRGSGNPDLREGNQNAPTAAGGSNYGLNHLDLTNSKVYFNPLVQVEKISAISSPTVSKPRLHDGEGANVGVQSDQENETGLRSSGGHEGGNGSLLRNPAELGPVGGNNAGFGLSRGNNAEFGSGQGNDAGLGSGSKNEAEVAPAHGYVGYGSAVEAGIGNRSGNAVEITSPGGNEAGFAPDLRYKTRIEPDNAHGSGFKSSPGNEAGVQSPRGSTAGSGYPRGIDDGCGLGSEAGSGHPRRNDGGVEYSQINDDGVGYPSGKEAGIGYAPRNETANGYPKGNDGRIGSPQGNDSRIGLPYAYKNEAGFGAGPVTEAGIGAGRGNDTGFPTREYLAQTPNPNGVNSNAGNRGYNESFQSSYPISNDSNREYEGQGQSQLPNQYIPPNHTYSNEAGAGAGTSLNVPQYESRPEPEPHGSGNNSNVINELIFSYSEEHIPLQEWEKYPTEPRKPTRDEDVKFSCVLTEISNNDGNEPKLELEVDGERISLDEPGTTTIVQEQVNVIRKGEESFTVVADKFKGLKKSIDKKRGSSLASTNRNWNGKQGSGNAIQRPSSRIGIKNVPTGKPSTSSNANAGNPKPPPPRVNSVANNPRPSTSRINKPGDNQGKKSVDNRPKWK